MWRQSSSDLLSLFGWGHHGFRVRSRVAANVGLVLVLLLPFVGDQIAFQERMREHNPDLKGWLDNAATLMASPGDPFYPQNPFYIYPPYFLTAIWPLTKLPVPLTAFVFEALKWVALFVSLRIAWRLAAPAGEDVPPIVALGSLLCTWRFIDNDLGQGNVNLFILLLMVGSAWLVFRRWPIAGGFVLALAAGIKVAPALLAVYYVYKGHWRTLIGTALGAVVCLVLWPALFFGWENNWRLLGEWYHAVVAGYVQSGAVRSEHANQALIAIVNRLFGPYPAFVNPERYMALIVLSDTARQVIRIGLAVGVLGALAWGCRRRADVRRTPAWAAEVGLVLIAMLLLSGLSWKAHYVTMIVPYAVLLAFVTDARHATSARRTVGIWLAVSFALCTLTSDVITPRGADYAEVYGAVALGAIAAAIGLWRVRAALAEEAGCPGLSSSSSTTSSPST